MRSLNAEQSAKWMEKGNILLHPTEGVWGLGCDPFNLKSIERVFELKGREREKKFILLFRDLDSVNLYSDIIFQKAPASGVPTGFPSKSTVVHPLNNGA